MLQFLYILTSTLFFLYVSSTSYAQNCSVIIRQVIDSSRSVKTIEYKVRKIERFKNLTIEQYSYCKVSQNPFKLYIQQLQPQKGLEVLYTEGTNNNKVLINPNGFPWTTFSLCPYDNLIREKQHHTIYESGFLYFATILDTLSKKHHAKFSSMLTYNGLYSFDNQLCYKITLNNTGFHYYKYKALKGETVLAIAKKFTISEYMILEKNPTIGSYNKNIEYQTILIPSDYAKQLVIYISKTTMLPLIISVFDEKGQFEYYEYQNLAKNPHFNTATFLSFEK